jgi:2-oxoglutarate dehydrogenase complex dehydrogenase (E1) component-like enzyme
MAMQPLAGQGIIYEDEQMAKLPGYYTRGTLHFGNPITK